MRIKLPIAMLSLTAAFALAALAPAAFAQTTPPPAAAEKPAAPMKPRAAAAEEVASKKVSVAEKAQRCLKIEETMDRGNCYDAAVKPQPNPNPLPVKGILDCRHLVDTKERLGCFDGFAVQIPKFTH
jgi:hypothetical protein